jgi:multidrug resistance efflux pump
MPLIIKNRTDRIAFQFGTRSALRATNKVVEQLQAQLKAERAIAAAKLGEKQRELAAALLDLAEARYQLAQRDTLDAFAKAPSPSTSFH